MKPGEAAANRGFYAGKFVWKRTVKGQRALGTGKKKRSLGTVPPVRGLSLPTSPTHKSLSKSCARIESEKRK